MDDVALLRPAEAANSLGVSLCQLRRLAATGHLVTVRTLGAIAATARTMWRPFAVGCNAGTTV